MSRRDTTVLATVDAEVEAERITQAGRPGAGEGTTKAGRPQSARLSREGRMIGDLALSARRLRLSE
jgi:hypothetical protein